MTEQELLSLASGTGALLEGHFLLRSGLHSRQFFQCGLLLSDTKAADQVAAAMADKFRDVEVETVIAPAIGGIVVGQDVARHLGVRSIFAEKDANDDLVLRRGFKIKPGEKILIAEDVVTRGGRVQQTIDLVRELGGEVVGVVVIVDRSSGNASFDVPRFESIVQLNIETFDPSDCPMCKEGSTAYKPGS